MSLILTALTGMPSWAWKILGGAALIAACLLMVKCYGDSKIAEGEYKERIRKYGELEVQLLANQKIAAAELAKLRETNEREVAASQAAEQKILDEISGLERQLVIRLAELAKLRTVRDEAINRIPDSDVGSALRDQSRRLAGEPQPPD